MKIRKGFVSNSSSSSFIVKFPKRPETKEELVFFLDTRTLNLYTEYGIVDLLWRYYIESYDDISTEQYIKAIAENLLGIEYNSTIVGRILDETAYYGKLLEWMNDNQIPLENLFTKSVLDIVAEQYFNTADDSFKLYLCFSDEGSEIGSIWEHKIAPNIFGNYLIKHTINH